MSYQVLLMPDGEVVTTHEDIDDAADFAADLLAETLRKAQRLGLAGAASITVRIVEVP